MQYANGGVDPHGGEVKAEVSWSVPATGTESLTPEQARILAQDLETIEAEEHSWRDTLKLLLNGKSPRVVAAELRDEADKAEAELDEWRSRHEEADDD